MIYWFVIALALFLLELFTGMIYLLVLSSAFAGAGLAAWLLPEFAFLPMLTLLVLASVGTAFAWRWQQKMRLKKAAWQVAADDLDLGQLVVIQGEKGADGYWLVDYRGTRWQAKGCEQEQSGAQARIIGKEGNILLIAPL